MVDDTAIAHQRGWLGQQGGLQQGGAVGGRGECCLQADQQWHGGLQRGELLGEVLGAQQGLAQAHQFARAHLAQRGAGGDAFHIAGALERLAQMVKRATTQRANGLQAFACRGTVAAGFEQPAL